MPVYLVAGMAFGDEGKGQTVDALVRHVKSDLVVRYNGGAQAAHNVVTSYGQHHTFSQWGSGTFVEGCRTYLSRFVLINPVSMLAEEKELCAMEHHPILDGFERLLVDKRCVIITPFQKALNRLEEMWRSSARHGSTGMGIGVARRHHLQHGDNVLFAGDLQWPETVVANKLQYMRALCIEEFAKLNFYPRDNKDFQREYGVLTSGTVMDWLFSKYSTWMEKVQLVDELPLQYNNPVFEGAQGMLLDEKYGFQPHTTWTDITFKNAETLLAEVGNITPRIKIGVWRTYFTRHGAGPFPSEKPAMTRIYHESHNKAEYFTGAFRVGDFDLPLALYAVRSIGGLDSLAINHLDAPVSSFGVRLARDTYRNFDEQDLLSMLEGCIGVPVAIKGRGITNDDREIDTEKLHAKADYAERALGQREVHPCI